MRHIVTTCDGIQFVVESDAKSVIFDQDFAAARTAVELAEFPDFFRIRSLDDMYGPLPTEPGKALIVWIPPVKTPAERRAAFRLIQGGRP